MVGIIGILLLVYIGMMLTFGILFYIGVFHSARGISEQIAIMKLRNMIIFNFVSIIKKIDTDLKDISDEHLKESKFLFIDVKEEAIQNYAKGDLGLLVLARYIIKLQEGI